MPTTGRRSITLDDVDVVVAAVTPSRHGATWRGPRRAVCLLIPFSNFNGSIGSALGLEAAMSASSHCAVCASSQAPMMLRQLFTLLAGHNRPRCMQLHCSFVCHGNSGRSMQEPDTTCPARKADTNTTVVTAAHGK